MTNIKQTIVNVLREHDEIQNIGLIVDGLVEALQPKIRELQFELGEAKELANFYSQLLGPNGCKVVKYINDHGIKSMGAYWTEYAMSLTGEERAAVVLEWIAAPKEEFEFDDSETVNVRDLFLEKVQKGVYFDEDGNIWDGKYPNY